jgi:hypothetical protein
LVDARATKLLDRYRLTLKDVFEGLEPLQERMAARLVPPMLRFQLAAAERDVTHKIDSLTAQLGEFDPTLGAATAKSRDKILYQLKKIENKTARETFRRDAHARADAAFLHAQFYYDQHLQERFYTIVPFLARHGMGLIDKVYEHVKLECPDHIILTV